MNFPPSGGSSSNSAAAPEDHLLYDMDQPPPPTSFPAASAPASNELGGGFGYQQQQQQQQTEQTMSGKEQALMWQQGHYMGGRSNESGFISAATTQPSSRSGHDDDVGMSSCYASSSLYDLDSSAQQSDVGGSSVHSSSFGLLSNPEEFIPRLVASLCDDDPVVVHESLILVERCVKKENFFNTLIRSSDLVGAIVRSLVASTSQMAETANALAANANEELEQQLEQAEKRTKSASNILRSMTNHHHAGGRGESDNNQRVACQNILAMGGVAPLTALLGYPIDRIKFNAVATLHSLLLCLDHQDETAREAAKNAVREANGVHLMVNLLQRDNNKLLTILTDCLRILAMRNQPTKMVILQGNGPQLLVGILHKQTYKNLILMTARLLKVLSVCQHNKQAIIQAGGMEALAKHLRSDQSKITYNCSWTMRNLSDVATMGSVADPARLAEELVRLLGHTDEPVVVCAAGILSNLTVNNEKIKLAVCEAGGIQELLRVIDDIQRKNDDATEVLEPSLCALRHLTHNHKAAELAQRLFLFDLDGLAKIGRFLHPQLALSRDRPSAKAVLGIVRNLAQRPANHHILRDKHTVDQVLVTLSAALDQLFSNPSSSGQGGGGVRLEEVVEASLGCVFHLAKEPSNLHLVRDVAVVRLLKRILMACGNETVVRLTAGIINEIASSDVQGAYILHREGLQDQLKNFVGSRNDKIAAYANSIIYRLTNVKNEMDKGNFHPSNFGHQQQQNFGIGGGGDAFLQQQQQHCAAYHPGPTNVGFDNDMMMGGGGDFAMMDPQPPPSYGGPMMDEVSSPPLDMEGQQMMVQPSPFGSGNVGSHAGGRGGSFPSGGFFDGGGGGGNV